jgi:lysylphosphatidylglycerol synthetase-like protein (DUF2156 family)
MATRDRIEDEVEKTLRSFDEDTTLKENPFLLARIKLARENRLYGGTRGFAPRIHLIQILALLILLINVITMFRYFEWNKESVLQEKLILALKEDFQIVQSQEPF